MATDADGDEITVRRAGSFTIAVQDDIPVQVHRRRLRRRWKKTAWTPRLLRRRLASTATICRPATRKLADTNADDEASGGGLAVWPVLGRGGRAADDLAVDDDERAADAVLEGRGGHLCGRGQRHGTPADPSDDISTLTATAGGRTVFTLVVNADGSWTFDLDDQLDHVDDGANDENVALQLVCERRVGVTAIDFSSIVVATDADGDEIPGAASGQLHGRGSGRHSDSGCDTDAGCGDGGRGRDGRRGCSGGVWSQRRRSVDRQQGSWRTQRGRRGVGCWRARCRPVLGGSDEPLTHHRCRRHQRSADAVLEGRGGHLCGVVMTTARRRSV